MSMMAVSWLRIGVAVSVGLTCAPAFSQTAATQDDGKREFTVSGCLLRSGYAGYQLDPARVEAIDGKALEPASAAARPDLPKKWILEGGGNLGASTGKKVEVIGRSEWQPPPAAAPADEPPNRTPHLDVKSVKVIAPTCP